MSWWYHWYVRCRNVSVSVVKRRLPGYASSRRRWRERERGKRKRREGENKRKKKGESELVFQTLLEQHQLLILCDFIGVLSLKLVDFVKNRREGSWKKRGERNKSKKRQTGNLL